MKIQTISTGELHVNTYLLTDQATKQMAVIDPGAPDRLLMDIIRAQKDHVAMILLTHGHFDHIGGVEAIRKLTNAPVYALEEELELLTDSRKNLSAYFGDAVTVSSVNPLHDGDTVTFGNITLQVMHTPGHSPGSACFLTQSVLFSGDTLFAESVGRTDLWGGNPTKLMQSVSKLVALLGNYRVLPGHGDETTLEHERLYNLYCGKGFRR